MDSVTPLHVARLSRRRAPARCPEILVVDGIQYQCARKVHSGGPDSRHWAAGCGWQSWGGRNQVVRREAPPEPSELRVPVPVRRKRGAMHRKTRPVRDKGPGTLACHRKMSSEPVSL